MVERLEELLSERLRSAHELDEKLKGPEYGKVMGASKLRNRLASELKFLEGVVAGRPPLEKKYIETSNVTHFENIVNGMDRYSHVTAVFHTFALLNKETNETLKHTVDIVCEGGLQWVKVISRSARGLAMDWVSGNARHIFEQADSYLEMASLFPRNFNPPEVVFEFICGIGDKMAARLKYMGVKVIGEQVPLDSIVNMPEDFLEMLEEGMDENEEESGEGSAELPPVNLDVSAVFVLVSNMTHPGGTKHRFDSTLLKQQAEMEKKIPAREQLLNQITGRKWIICRTAYESVCNIVSTVAGPTEKKRVDELWSQIEIVEDQVSERADTLSQSDRINMRSMTIFGSGDSHRAVTATANKHFVSSAFHQGVCFDVIIHESRALSEQKERAIESEDN